MSILVAAAPKKFRLKCEKLHLTYKTHIDMDTTMAMFKRLGPMKMWSFVHELGETKGTLSAWPYWSSPTARWEDELDMIQLYRELLAMTGREKELAITSNTMLRGLHRYGLHEFDGPASPQIDQITFIVMACEELEKMKKMIHKPLIVRPTPITPITKPQSNSLLGGG